VYILLQVEVDRMVKTERENERALCARMFGGGAQPSLKKPAISDDTYEELVWKFDHSCKYDTREGMDKVRPAV